MNGSNKKKKYVGDVVNRPFVYMVVIFGSLFLVAIFAITSFPEWINLFLIFVYIAICRSLIIDKTYLSSWVRDDKENNRDEIPEKGNK